MALPLILALGSGIMGAKNAQDEKRDLRRQSDMDAMIQSGKTAYSGFTGGPQGELKAGAGGPSVMGNALAGGVAGYSQGQAFDQASAQNKANNAYAMLKQKQMAAGVPPTANGVAMNTMNPYNRTALGLPPEMGV